MITEEKIILEMAKAISPSWWTDLMPNGDHPLDNYPDQHVFYRETSIEQAKKAYEVVKKYRDKRI